MIYFIIAFGAVIGSFLNVCIARIPVGTSIIHPGSSCPFCRTKIKYYDNIPIFSYFFLLGRCRRCGRRISFIYPLVELLMAFFAYFTYIKYGFTINAALVFILVSALIVVSFIDLKHYMIPDSISITGIVIGFAASFLPNGLTSPMHSLIGLLLGGGGLLIMGLIYEKLTGKEGIGGGDIKLLAMMGAFLGYKSVLLIIFLSSTVGAICGSLILLILSNKDRHSVIPFGPFLSLGALVSVFYGEAIISYYLSLF